MRPAPASSPVVGDIKLTFVYDYRSQQVARQAWHWDGSEWDTDVDDDLQMFVYDEWNVALVLKGSTETVTHQYTWGLDLSGLSEQRAADFSPRGDTVSAGTHGAEGIGGLLVAVEDNVGQSPILLLSSTYLFASWPEHLPVLRRRRNANKKSILAASPFQRPPFQRLGLSLICVHLCHLWALLLVLCPQITQMNTDKLQKAKKCKKECKKGSSLIDGNLNASVSCTLPAQPIHWQHT